MLLELYPRMHRRYASLPVLGSALDGYGAWLLRQGYSTDRVRASTSAQRRGSFASCRSVAYGRRPA